MPVGDGLNWLKGESEGEVHDNFDNAEIQTQVLELHLDCLNERCTHILIAIALPFHVILTRPTLNKAARHKTLVFTDIICHREFT